MANLQNNIEYLSDKIQNTFSNQQGIESMESRDILSNTLIPAQSTSNTITPNVVYEEHNMKINNINNQSLGTDLSNEKEYSVDYNVKNDLKTKAQMYEQNQNEDDDQEHAIDHQTLESYVPEQEYNSYDQYNVIENEQENTNTIQDSDAAALSQYSTLDTQ